MDPVTVDVNRQWRAVTWPAFSHGFNLERFTGWKPGSVSVRGESIEVEEGHGEYDLPVFRGRRIIDMAGYVVANSDWEIDRMADRFAAVLADGRLGSFTVDDRGERRWAKVRLFGTPEFEPTYRARADFSLEVRAPDPRIFGKAERQTGASVDVVNRGTFPSSPVVQVSGSGTANYGVYGPDGRRWIVSQDLVPGHVHVLDIESGDLAIDGNLIIGGLVEADAFVCPPMKKTTISLDPNGNTATMTVINRPTYI